MYKAIITNKRIEKGKLIVEVSFDNGTENFNDVFETTQAQNDTWMGEQITRRLHHLNSLAPLGESIRLGEFIEPIVDIKRKEYKTKSEQYVSYMNIARSGFINHDRPIIQELRTWLRENFKDNYMDLF